MESRSNVWDHYIKVRDENGNVKKGKCKYCAKDLCDNPSKNGTSSLHNHLKSCKSFNVEGRQTKLAFQANKDGTSLTNWTFDKDLSREKYTKMIIVDELPFKFEEGSGFRDLWLLCNPCFKSIKMDGCT